MSTILASVTSPDVRFTNTLSILQAHKPSEHKPVNLERVLEDQVSGELHLGLTLGD